MSGLKSKLVDELTLYEQFSCPEQTVGSQIWHTERMMNALTSAECWSDQGGRCGSEINQAKDLLDSFHANRDQWTGSLTPGVCVDLDVAALALVKVVVNKVLADQDQDIAANAFMSFYRTVKWVKSDYGRSVHKAVL